jgi:hypothetical protein
MGNHVETHERNKKGGKGVEEFFFNFKLCSIITHKIIKLEFQD